MQIIILLAIAFLVMVVIGFVGFVYYVLPWIILMVVLEIVFGIPLSEWFEKFMKFCIDAAVVIIIFLIVSGIITYALGWGDWIANLHACGFIYC